MDGSLPTARTASAVLGPMTATRVRARMSEGAPDGIAPAKLFTAEGLANVTTSISPWAILPITSSASLRSAFTVR